MFVVLAVALALGGCETLRQMTPKAREEAETATQLLQLQARNMRFADEYVGRLMEVGRGLRSRAGSPEQRYNLAGWLLGQANSVCTDASGENPVVCTFDLVTLATLSRMVVEDVADERFPQRAEAIVEVHRKLEASAWQLTEGMLSPAQQADLRKLLDDWHAQNPGFTNVLFIRFQDFVAILREQGPTATGHASGLLALFGLDPMAGLDPAVRQVEQTRLLAERAIFYAQRVPVIFDLQLDRSIGRIAVEPETQRLLQETASITSSSQRFVAVAEALPDAFAREREALIRQLSHTLSAQEATLRPMLLELRQALEAGHITATSVDQAVRSIDALTARFARKPGDPGTGRPFNITEYAQAAMEITRAANELQRLIGAFGTQAPHVGHALEAGASEGRSLVDYLFVRVAWLIALLCLGLLGTLLLYRWLATRIRPS